MDLGSTLRRGAIAVALAVMVAIPAGSTAAASPTACKVKNVTRGGTYTSLGAAVKNARNGNKLSVRGTCITGRTLIAKRLTIYGVRNATSGPPTLRGTSWGPTLMIQGETSVIVKGLTIKGRKDVVLPANRRGGGIYVGEGCKLTLQNVTVKEFRSNGFGGGIATEGGTVRLLGTTRIQGNKAASGGGIWASYAKIVMQGKSVVRWNKGDGIRSDGPVTMKWESAVSGNTGSGISGGDPTRLFDRASIHHNSERGIVGATAVLRNSAAVHHNSDGGIRAEAVELHDNATVRDNAADTGAGLLEFEALEMSGNATITGNTAKFNGGGLFHRSRATLTGVTCAPAPGANVYDNAPNDCYDY